MLLSILSCQFSNVTLTKLYAQAENIKYTLEQQMVFFARLVGKHTVADDIIPVKVDNLDWLGDWLGGVKAILELFAATCIYPSWVAWLRT